jgi:hypothetical protein
VSADLRIENARTVDAGAARSTPAREAQPA